MLNNITIKTKYTYSKDFGIPSILLDDNESNNVYYIDNEPFVFTYINEEFKKSRGGNSFVFKLIPQDEENRALQNLRVIKISKYYDDYDYNDNKVTPSDPNKRFYREIKALVECQDKENIVKVFGTGRIVCKTTIQRKKAKLDQPTTKTIDVYFPFYIMEYAKEDLRSYIENSIVNLDLHEKLLICRDLAVGIVNLHDAGFYHRDIKPDNIFHFDMPSSWKIGDLGLVDYRDQDTSDIIKETNEFIGPRGWISPEVMNKFLTENKYGNFDCKIDDKSDVFQLGKVFWYVIQGNAPIGNLSSSDFVVNDTNIFGLIKSMLYHAKDKRPTINQVVSKLSRLIETT